LVRRERFNDVWGRTSTDEKEMSSISYDTYLFQVKRVDEMFVIILKMISLNLFGCKEVKIVYSDFINQALNLTY
jgi:hypothetical protein